MQTSYFAKFRGDNGCNIAMKPIQGFKGISYPDLYPKWYFLKKYKDAKEKSKHPDFLIRAQEEYIKEYNKVILNKLNPEKVYVDLKDYVLLCYEKPGDFCHRRLVAEWIEKTLGIKVPEIVY